MENTKHWLDENGRPRCGPPFDWEHHSGQPHPVCGNCGKELVGDEAPE